MSSTKDALDHTRQRMLVGMLVGFALWQGIRIADGFAVAHTDWVALRWGLLATGLAGWLCWSYYLVRMLMLGRKLRAEPALAAALNDEFIQHGRLRAFATAFWVVMAGQAVAAGFGAFLRLDGALVANITILIGVSAAIGAFLLYTRE